MPNEQAAWLARWTVMALRRTWVGGAALAVASVIALVFWTDTFALGAAKVLRTPPVQPVTLTGHEGAIVVLAGGIERIRSAVQVQRTTGLPLLVIGQLTDRDKAELFQTVAGPYALHPNSTTTQQDAALSRCIAQHASWRRVVLVTDEMHMRRARGWFWWYGLSTAPISTPLSYMSSKPVAEQRRAVADSARHELAGMLGMPLASIRRPAIDCHPPSWSRPRPAASG